LSGESVPEKKKRKYTFRKGQPIPYESGSFVHRQVKALKEDQRTFEKRAEELFGVKKRKRR
jgi:hypothetical protein